MIEPCSVGVIHLKLSLEGQECSRHIPAEYSEHTDASSPNFTAELPKRTGINNHPIKMTF